MNLHVENMLSQLNMLKLRLGWMKHNSTFTGVQGEHYFY